MTVSISSPKHVSRSQSCHRIRKKTPTQQENEKLSRQMKTLVRKINKMATHFGIDIAMHARYRSTQQLYTSSSNLSWPPNIQDVLECSYPVPVVQTPASLSTCPSNGRERKGT